MMRRIELFTVMLAGLVLCSGLLLASAAQAQAVLREAPVAAGDMVVVGDLFDGAGAAAATPLSRAPRAGSSLAFDARVLSARLRSLGVAWTPPAGVTRVVVNGETAGAAPSAAVREIAVLTRPIAAGEEITAADVAFLEVAAAPSGALTDPADLIGRAARRALAPDRPVRAAELRTPLLVRKGGPVTLVYEIGGVRVTARGRALADAGAGEAVKVVNIQSNRTIDAVAEADGLARVAGAPAPFRSAAR
jgi:flagella basal body P-ring formation protein FlgA